MPRPGLQRKRAAAALALEPGRPSRSLSANTRYPAGRPHTPPADRMYATDVRHQTAASLNALGRGHNKRVTKFSSFSVRVFVIPLEMAMTSGCDSLCDELKPYDSFLLHSVMKSIVAASVRNAGIHIYLQA